MESPGHCRRAYSRNGIGYAAMNVFGTHNIFTDLRTRLRSLLNRTTVDRELDEELRFHVEQHVEKLMQSGIPETEARRQACLLFGSREQIKEECHEARGTHLLETLWQDIHYSARILRKSPAFALTVILTLALGIGATTSMFSVVQGVMLAPLPYPEPDRLVLIWQSNPHAPHVSMSILDYRDWQSSARSFASRDSRGSTWIHGAHAGCSARSARGDRAQDTEVAPASPPVP